MFRYGMREILKRLAQEFELILFTSGAYEYAHAAVDLIEREERYF